MLCRQSRALRRNSPTMHKTYQSTVTVSMTIFLFVYLFLFQSPLAVNCSQASMAFAAYITEGPPPM